MAGLTKIKSGGITPGCDLDGSGTLKLDSTNNRVGINEASPTHPLHIDADVDQLRLSDGDGGFDIRAGNILKISDDGSERIRIDSSGNVGIGTTAPGTPLHVSSSSGTQLTLQRTSLVSEFGLKFTRGNRTDQGIHTDGAGISFRGVDAANGYTQIKIAGDNTDANDYDRIEFAVEGSERMRIDSSGNVGIGATSPSQLLELKGSNAQLIINGTTTTDCGIEFQNNATSFAEIKLDTSSGILDISETQTSGVIAFSTGASGTERMRIDSSGRLLVGTSTVTTTASTSTNNLLAVESTNNYSGVSFTANCNDSNGSYLVLKKSRGTATGSTTVVQSGDEIGNIFFEATDGSASRSAAAVRAFVDGTPGAADMPGRLVFYTTADGASSPTERMRLNSLGSFKVTSDGTYESGADIQNHIIQQHNSSRFIIANTHASEPYGFYVTYPNADPNNASSDFLYCDAGSSSTLRAAIRSNGGLANYSSNNSNLCDEREKKNIETLDSTWGCLKNWELKKFHYNEDDDSDDKRYGVIAQQVAPHCPELITNWVKQQAKDAVLDDDGNIVTPAVEEVNRMAVKEQQMMWMAIKALQEAQARIETLEAEVAALKSN